MNRAGARPIPNNNRLLFTKDGKTLAEGCEDGRVIFWDVASGKPRLTLNVGLPFNSMAMAPDGNTVAVVPEQSSVVKLWDVVSGKELRTEFQGEHTWEVSQLAFSPDGKSLFSTDYYSQIRQWDTKTWKTTKVFARQPPTLSGIGKVAMFAISRDSKRLAWPQEGNTVRIWDLADNKEALAIKVADSKGVESATFSPDGAKLFTWDAVPAKGYRGFVKECLRQWDLSTGMQEQVWKFANNNVSLDIIAPDAKVAVVARGDDMVCRDVLSGQDRWSTSLSTKDKVFQLPLAVSDDGRLLASGDTGFGQAWALRIWEMATGKEVFEFHGHDCRVTVAGWSPDGCFVASAVDSHFPGYRDPRVKQTNTVRLWNALAGTELAVFDNLAADVKSLTISPDNTLLVAGLRDSTIVVLDVSKQTSNAKMAPKQFSPMEMENCWAALEGDDAAKAHQAAWKLIVAGQPSVSLLQKRLKPAAAADAVKIQKWIADLESDKFGVRQAAMSALVKVGEQARAPLEKARAGNIPLETRRRLAEIIKGLELPRSETLRTMRAIMVLEKIGSPEARGVLTVMARGAAGAWETEEAKATLVRLERRSARMP